MDSIYHESLDLSRAIFEWVFGHPQDMGRHNHGPPPCEPVPPYGRNRGFHSGPGGPFGRYGAHPLVRFAGVSGALAVTLGAYGSHGITLFLFMFSLCGICVAFRDKPEVSARQKFAFDTGNRYHLIHSAVLLASPLCKRPYLTGSLLSAGMFLFCGSCYHYAFTGKEECPLHMSVIDSAKELIGVALRPVTLLLKEEIRQEMGHKKGHAPPNDPPPPWFFASKHLKIHPMVQIAGLSGATACALGGWRISYFKDRTDVSDDRKFAFESANRVHMINSAVLLAVPQSNRPYIEVEDYLDYARYGGFLTIIAWLSLIF